MISLATMIILGAVFLAVVLAYFYRPVIALLIIPLTFAGYFLFSQEINARLGYPIDNDLIPKVGAYMISGVQSKEFLYLMIKEDGKVEPRLIRLKRSDSIDEKFAKLNKPETSKRIMVGKDLIPSEIIDTIKLKSGEDGTKSKTKGKSKAGSDGENTNQDGLSLTPDDDIFKKEG